MSLRRWKRISLIIFFCLSFLLFRSPWVFGQSEHTTKLIEGAKKEGKLVWYSTSNIRESKTLLEMFEKKYPFLKTQLFRASQENLWNRIMTEARAGRWEFDIVNGSGIDTLAQQRLISPYISPEAKVYPPDFRDPAGSWTAIFSNYYVLGYNTKLVPEKEAPRRWEDLLEPKWRGRISIDREEYEWFATLLSAWGSERTEKYMKSLAEQHVQWRKGHTLIAQLMAAGEFPLAIVYAHRIESMKKEGAPVDWVSQLNPIVAAVIGIGMSAKAQHPNAARLFVDFVLSKEGQEVIRSLNRIPVRLDVEPLSPKMDLRRIRVQTVPSDMTVRYQEYAQEFRKIFGL